MKRIRDIVLFVGLIIVFLRISDFFYEKEIYNKNYDFHNNNQDYDVLFLGSSHMVMGISPMQLWDEYGITSYNLANHDQTIPTDYWILKNALDHTNTSLVVLDVVFASEDIKSDLPLYVHQTIDWFPLSKNKMLAVKDLLPNDEQKRALFRPLSYSHNSWRKADEDTFWKGGRNFFCRGYDTYYTSMIKEKTSREEWSHIDDVNLTETMGKDYLRRIVNECNKRNIKILLVLLPTSLDVSKQKYINSVNEIADENGVTFVNMNIGDTCKFLDYSTDFFDRGHLNASGSHKVTHWLGNYISENYTFSQEQNKKVQEIWDRDYNEFVHRQEELLLDCEKINEYIMLLSSAQYDIRISGTEDVLCDPEIKPFIENLGYSFENKHSMNENCKVVFNDELNESIKIEVNSFADKDFDDTVIYDSINGMVR